MAVRFHQVTCPPLHQFSAQAPSGALIGVVGEEGCGQGTLLRLAAGQARPAEGTVESGETRRLLEFGDALDLSPVEVLCLDHALARHDALARGRAYVALERLRRGGATLFLASHETDLLLRLADEIWWLDGGRLAGRGDPREVLEAYQRHVARRMLAWGASERQHLAPSFRRGDGRARLVRLETLGPDGRPAMVWASGDTVQARITVRFEQAVEDPVIGVMIRTRVGFEVYGTNTELEGVRLGPCHAGETLRVSFAFCCALCPQEYTLTAASHDPDGVWHDWLEDALAFSVTDARHTAGVANLRAKVAVERA